MTFEEARAQFPVLEKLAYLNAGTFGPIARTTHEAISAELERDYRDGRSGGPNFARVMELREQLRAAHRGPRRRRAAAGRAHDEHDRRLQHRPRRARARPGATRS